MQKRSIAITIFLFLSLVIITIITSFSYIAYQNSPLTLENEAKEQLVSLTKFRKKQIEDYLESHYFNINLVAKLPDTYSMYKELETYYSENYFMKDTLEKLYNKYDYKLDRLIRRLGYSNFFIIDNKNGRILYNLNKDGLIGTELKYEGITKNIFSTWKKVLKKRKIHLTDFYLSKLSTSKYALYVASPVVSPMGDNMATVIVEVPYYYLKNLMGDYSGLKNTGESILLNADTLLRNDLRFLESSAFVNKLKTKDILHVLGNQKEIKEAIDYRGKEVLSVGRKIEIPGPEWFLITKIDKEEILGPQIILKEKLIIISILMILIFSIITLLMARYYMKPVIEVKDRLMALKAGILPSKPVERKTNDEVGIIADAANKLVSNLIRVDNFASELVKGNLEVQYQQVDENDLLSDSLINLKNYLVKNRQEEEKRREEDRQHNWASEGIAKFASILRQNNNDIVVLSYDIIINMVEYLKANQGAIFLLKDDKDDPHLELLGAYAYDRRKFLKKQIKIGEGYVGTCFQEKEKILLTEIPEEYMEITSGLGKSNPKCILLIPLKFKEEVEGVIELASFSVFKPYQVEFVEKIAESIANTLINVRNQLRTERLLEESRKQGEKLQQQEEELRQNLEEMQATQEESAKIQNRNKHIIKAINKGMLMAEYDFFGKILSMNDAYLNLLNLEKLHLANHKHKDNLTFLDKYTHEGGYDHFWDDLSKGKVIPIVSKLDILQGTMKKTFIFKEIYIPVRKDGYKLDTVVKLAVDVTDMFGFG
ncbi:MAG: GAF domain-containing protein [bacterium]